MVLQKIDKVEHLSSTPHRLEAPTYPRALCAVSNLLSRFLILIAFPLIYGLPLLILYLVLSSALREWMIVAVIVTSPLTFSALVVLTAGTLSLPCQWAIVRAVIPHDLSYPPYAIRRLYGIAICSVIYFRPIYHLVLLVPFLKLLMFRMFGYRGSIAFTTYPDTWIRDLPLLRIGPGAYLSNRATIGTNIVMRDGSLLVDGITIGRKSIVGHLSMLAPGVVVGDDCEVGVGCAIGVGVVLNSGSRVGPCCGVDHATVIGSRVRIGSCSYVGTRCRIADDIQIPPGSVIPKNSVIETQKDVVAILGAGGDQKPGSAMDVLRVTNLPH